MDTFGKSRHIGKHHDKGFFWYGSEGQTPAVEQSTCSYLLLKLIESHIADSVFLPIFVIEVPPFRGVHGETL